MMTSTQTGQDAHDDYVKQLLDKRTALTNAYGRFSTPSDYSDTPSVYSRSFFSPRPQINGEPVSPVNGYTRSSHDHITSGSLDPNDINGHSYGSNRTAIIDNNEAEEDLDTESMSRMSMLGPKMRFHSRAPWETEEDTIREDETVPELERPAKSRFFNFVPSSPRIGNLGRPSGESTRSDVTRKMSLESTASNRRPSRNIVYTQSQANSSDTSLSKRRSGGEQDGTRQLSCGRLSRSPTSDPLPPRSTSPNQCPSADGKTIGFEIGSRDNVSMFRVSSTPSELHQGIHPYANPDLMVYTTDPDEQSQAASAPVDLVGSDSITTLTDPSFACLASKSNSGSTLTQTTPTTSVAPWKTSTSTIHGVQISTPLAVTGHSLQSDRAQRCNALLPGVQNLPGWMEKANNPGFSLISLEEARAQRAKSTVQLAQADELPNANLDGDQPYPEGVPKGRSSQHSTVIQRTRARSISAGTRAKNPLHSVVGMPARIDKREGELDSQANTVVAGKSIKPKKSGFMRLLVGSRTSEREERPQPPPLPVLPGTHASRNHPQADHKKLHRVPVPELSMHDEANARDKSSMEDSRVWLAKSAISPKRTPPPLTLRATTIKNTTQVVSSAIETSPRAQSVLVGTCELPCVDKASRSAPAHVIDFPALQLRPASTSFSSQFSEHLMKQMSPSELDTHTPHTSRPATPSSVGQTIHEVGHTASAPSLEDQSDVIRALREHIVSSKLTWQRQIWELEGQIHNLKAEVENLKAAAKEDYCESCGRGKPRNGNSAFSLSDGTQQSSTSVVDRPRARTGIPSRFGSSVA